MLVGHYAPALVVARHFPEVPLWALLVGAQAVDIAFWPLVGLGIEGASLHPGEHPHFVVEAGAVTHSLVMTGAYGALCLAGGAAAGRWRAGVAVALAVVSHWFMDWLVHVPDLPLAFDQAQSVGLGLWAIPHAAWALECAVLIAGFAWLGDRRLLHWLWPLLLLQTLQEWVIPVPESLLQVGVLVMVLYAACPWLAWRLAPPE